LEKLMTTNEVAERLQITRQTVQRMVRRGELNCYKVNRALRFDEKQIADYLAKVQRQANG